MSAGQLEAYLPLVLVVLVGYLFFVRPVRKRAQATARLQAALSAGDEVMLSSGLFATIVSVEDEVATVELAPGTVVRVHRGAVTQIIVDRPGGAEQTDDEQPDLRETPPGDIPGES